METTLYLLANIERQVAVVVVVLVVVVVVVVVTVIIAHPRVMLSHNSSLTSACVYT